MKKVYGVIGAGSASPKAIHTALDDLEEDAIFYVPFKRSAGPESVYDWLIDNEREFIVVGNAGKTLREFASEVLAADSEDLNMAVLENLGKEATVLVLWEEGLDDAIFKAHTKGHKILELSNGLTPIVVEEEGESSKKENSDDEADEDEDSSDLTYEELEKMPVAAIKRYAVNKGINIKGLSKDEIIDILYSSEAQKEDTTPQLVDEHVPIHNLIDSTGTASPVATIIVVYANGTTTTISSDYARLERMMAAAIL